MSRAIMVCGTGSHVGKSVIVAGLCRIFRQDGFRVAPFKSQNMALNSFVTEEGAEMGRAQVVQALAAGIKPHVDMNPILLKPSSDTGAQVIVLGKPVANMEAQKYDEYKKEVLGIATEAFWRLSRQYEIIVMEGAGSPAEINLKEDIANIKMAIVAKAPVILVGDIDLGGVFSWLYGTVQLLPEDQRRLVKGFIINKFRGDLEILRPGLKMIEQKTNIPVLGVIPYIQALQIDEEDSVACSRFSSPLFKTEKTPNRIKIEVLYLPHISNFTDFDPLNRHPWVQLRYVRPGDSFSEADVIIIPGTKNTIGDLKFLYEQGYADLIINMARRGVFVIGICGGYQMLGQTVADPEGHESGQKSINALGLLPITTIFRPGKITSQVKAVSTGRLPFFTKGREVTGYEIHMGQSDYIGQVEPLFHIQRNSTHSLLQRFPDGAMSQKNNVLGTYLHGLFDNTDFTISFLRFVANKRKIRLRGMPDYGFDLEAEFDRLANIIRNQVDMKRIYQIMEI